MKRNKKLVEKTVLNTFQEEIPSIYFSDKTKAEYSAFKNFYHLCIHIGYKKKIQLN